MRVVRALHAAQLVTEAALGDFASDAESCEVRAHRPLQIVQREVREAMVNAGESCIQGVDSDVQQPIAWVAPPFWENVNATACNQAQRFEPLDHFWATIAARWTAQDVQGVYLPERLEIRGTHITGGSEKDTPIHGKTLFDVLHLLAHLLNDHLQIHRTARGFEVLGLR
jgi:hypothetical protein